MKFAERSRTIRYKRVLLVNPPSRGEWKGFRPHIGLGYIAQTLVENGFEYDVLDMNLGYKFKHLQKKIDTFKPDLIGMSLLTLEYKKFYELISMVKTKNPRIKIVVGGPHVTILKEQVVKDCAAIDYAVLYEGEETLVELCKGEVSEENIKGLMSRNNGYISYPGDREFIMNLDILPFPRYGKFELKKYIPEVEIYSSRGCPHKCIFCPNRLLSPIFRVRSPIHVVDEIEYWYKKGFRQFNFDDDNFNKYNDRVYQICDEIERRNLKNLFLRCSNGIRADRVDRPLLARMKEVGFHYIAFGADAGNNKMLQLVKKGETIEDIEQALKNSYELGYDMKLLFVVGTPGETREDVEDKVRLSMKYPLNDVHFYNTIPYPGTELYDWIEKNDRFLKRPEDYLNDVTFCENNPIFDTPELSAEDRIQLFKYLEGIRKQVHKNAARRVLRHIPLLNYFAEKLITTDLFLQLFFKSFRFRTFIDRIRYKLAIRSNLN
jgi:radical SAM superfamily enzyme YgiQ (UPF0313 family)